MAGNFAPSFSLNFLCISQASLGWALWSGYYWKDLFHLQKLSINDTNFDQKWWRQKWKAKAHHGLHRSQWVKVELQNSKTLKQQYKFLLKKLHQLHGHVRNCICLTMSSICLFFLSHDLIALLNALFQKFDLCLVSPGEYLLPHPSPKALVKRSCK